MNVTDILLLAGGIALFLFGMNLMGDGLKKVAGKKLEVILYKLSGTPLRGILLGTGVTAVIQSSSATSVMVVGFVNSRMMKVRQAISVIMGAIIGTSITGWIVCLSDLGSGAGSTLSTASGWLELLSTESLASITALVGILIYMFSKDSEKKHIGSILLGFAVLMFGMKTMSGSVSDLRSNPAFLSVLTNFSNPILGILVGAAFTGILQSASASVGILQALASTGAITFQAALPILMGIAIGAAVPVLLSALGATADGKRTALSYLAVDVLGVIIISIVFYVLNAVLNFSFMSAVMSSASLALLNTCMRIIITLVLFPFLSILERVVRLIIRDNPNETVDTAEMERLEERFLIHPALAIEQSRLAVNSMARQAQDNLNAAFNLLDDYTPEGFAALNRAEEIVDRYEDRLGTYLVKLMRREMDKHQNEEVTKYLHAITDFERISDHAVNIAESAKEIHDKNISFSPEGLSEIALLRRASAEIMSLAVRAFVDGDLAVASRIEPLEELTDDLCDQMKVNHIDRIRKDICTLEHGFVFNDFLTDCERISDHCSNIGVALIELNSDEYDVHRYTADLKEGHSRVFNIYYQEYAEQFKIQ